MSCPPFQLTISNWQNLSQPDKAAVREFLDRADTANPLQDPAFAGDGTLGEGTADHWFWVTKNAQVSAVGYGIENFAMGRYLPRWRCLIFPKGPVAGDSTALLASLQLIEQTARARGMIYIDIQPQWMGRSIDDLHKLASAQGWSRVATSTATMTWRLDLRRQFDEIVSDFDKATRYELRRAEKIGIEVRNAKSKQEVDEFYDCYRATYLRKGFEGIDRERIFRLVSRLSQEPSRGWLLIAKMGGDFLGGIVVLRAGPCLHYVYGATTGDPNLRKLPIGYALHWQAISLARDLGLETYDFGGYSPDPNNKVARFKARFRGHAVQIAPSYRRVLRPHLFRLSDLLKRAKGSGVARSPDEQAPRVPDEQITLGSLRKFGTLGPSREGCAAAGYAIAMSAGARRIAPSFTTTEAVSPL